MKYLTIVLALLMDAAVLYTLFGIGNTNFDWMTALVIAVLVLGTVYHCTLAWQEVNDD